jgi:alpha-mannosidase
MSDSWLRHLDPSGLVFSYVMNNYWETNYKADQEGEVEFRYALTPYRGAYDALEATRRGMAEVRPLLARPAEPRSVGLESAVEVSTPGVVITSMGRAPDGEGLLVRLFAASGRPETVDLSVGGRRLDEVEITDLDGYDGERVELPLGMPAWGIRTVKLPGPS